MKLHEKRSSIVKEVFEDAFNYMKDGSSFKASNKCYR